MPFNQPISQLIDNIKQINTGFAGIITAVSAWSIWGSDMFPAGPDPKGGINLFYFLFFVELF